jgi:cytochrome d ubiquinol oxidase subunit II
MTLEFLQNYWWLLVSVLGALLVFLLFVQGGQSMLLTIGSAKYRELIVNSMGRKWELTFTTLVTFGGAFFASFPLFYSTSFGGAYWLWILILLSFILQAISYEYRNKKGNIYGTRTYDTFLFINGCVGCILLGVAVSMFFFGAHFTVAKGSLLNAESPIISTWVATHGLEAIFNWRNLVLGVVVLFLARMQANLYMMNSLGYEAELFVKLKKNALINGGIFVVFFLAFLALILTADGCSYTINPDGTTTFTMESFKYLNNYISMPWAFAMLLIGVVMVLYGFIRSIVVNHYTHGIWWTGIGTVFVVLTLFFVTGYCNTAYYVSLEDITSSLTIRNSSSSHFTLATMSIVSLIIPFVLAYIVYVWRAMDKKKLTTDELEKTDHKY